MQAAANELHEKVDTIPSSIPSASTPQSASIAHGRSEATTLTWILDPLSLPPQRRFWIMFYSIEYVRNGRWDEQRQNQYPEKYKKWYDSHKEYCMKNFSGSSQSMEPEDHLG